MILLFFVVGNTNKQPLKQRNVVKRTVALILI